MDADAKRLNIWQGVRRDFARHLRAQRIAAIATPRHVCGEIKAPKTDGMHRDVAGRLDA
jgi:hypothetical protein